MKWIKIGERWTVDSVKKGGGLLLFYLAVGWIVIVGMGAVLAPWVSPYDPTTLDIQHILEAPSKWHWLGTDSLGRDLLSRILYGARISLMVGFLAVGISTVIGILVGSLAGYGGGWGDRVIVAFIDLMLSFPTFFLIIAITAASHQSGIVPIMIIIGLTSWMTTARLVRAQILKIKQMEFYMAAVAMNASAARLIAVHLIPNALGPVYVTATLGIAGAILVESALSFLGIGIQPPTPSWGNILTDGKMNVGYAWWQMLFPGLAIFLTVFSYYIVGDALREKMESGKR